MNVVVPVDEPAVRAALAEVPDPEIPALSIVDLGLVEQVTVADTAIGVELLPTFIGCPALDAIRDAVAVRLAPFGRPVHVHYSYTVPWTTDRMTPVATEALRASGIAPPGARACPWCGSTDVVRENLFGPTLCRSLHYCRRCRQPFEAFKEV